MRFARPRAAGIAALLVFGALGTALVAAGSAAPVLPPVVELPPWAVGFYWTYHYEGNDSESFAGFTATQLNDTYTSAVIGETTTPRGDAWVVRNSHAGTMSGYAPVGPARVPGTAAFTSVTYTDVRKSDLATLNFTQDLDITANIQIIGNIHALAHNETYAEPPLQDVPIGGAADGTPWHVYSNLTSVGWYEIQPGPRTNVSSYLVFDYNLSVIGAETITVPAGTFDAYNLTGFGTMDFNGTLYSYAADYLWSPAAQQRVRDEAGFLLMSHFVNRAPRWAGAEPYVRVDAGGYNDSLDLSTLIEDPEGQAVSFANCTADLPLSCSVTAGGALNVSSPTGVNATLNVTVTASDGLPGGNFSARVRVLVRGPGNANQPPQYAGPADIYIDEDTDYVGRVVDLFTDPEGDALTVSLAPSPPLFLVSENDTDFHLRPPPNYFGVSGWTATAYDTAGNFVVGASIVHVRSVNDVPTVFPLSPTLVDLHDYQSITLSAGFTDQDEDNATHVMEWALDGVPVFSSSTVFNYTYAPAGVGASNHTVNVTVSDGVDVGGPVTFSILVWGGPRAVALSPQSPSITVENGTSFTMQVSAGDDDTETLEFRWYLDGGVIASGAWLSEQSVDFFTPGAHTVEVQVWDNATNATVRWDVFAEALPPRPAGIDAPLDGLEVTTNETVALRGFVDPGFTDVQLAWRVDGVLFDSSNESETGTLAAGVHSITFTVSGTYHHVIPYNATFAVHVTSVAPAPPGGGNNTTAPPAPRGNDLLLWVVLAAVAAGGAGAAYVAWRRRRAPTADGPDEPEG